MRVTGTTEQELRNTLAQINRDFYDGNIAFKRLEPTGPTRKSFIFTLTVNDSRKPGARRGFQRKKDGERYRLAAACWHAHGNFFEELFERSPNAVITSMGRKIDANQGNWEDKQVGSLYDPVYHSKLCDC